jgi:O-antigen/teichoic acid export membrane protein
MVTPVLWLCNAILVNQPGGYAQMGLFDAANQWRMAILFLPGVVGQVVLPMLANLDGLDDQVGFRKALKYNALINGGVALVVSMPVVFLAPYIMKTYGPGFEEGSIVLIILSICTILVSINNVVGQAIASKGRMWIGFFFNLLWATSLIIMSQEFIKQGGACGLAIAMLIAYLIHSICQFFYMKLSF